MTTAPIKLLDKDEVLEKIEQEIREAHDRLLAVEAQSAALVKLNRAARNVAHFVLRHNNKILALLDKPDTDDLRGELIGALLEWKKTSREILNAVA